MISELFLWVHYSYDERYVTFQVNTYIEDCIAQKDPLIKILRLVCMQSVCNNGLKQKVFDYYKREILQVQSKTQRFVFGWWCLFCVCTSLLHEQRKIVAVVTFNWL